MTFNTNIFFNFTVRRRYDMPPRQGTEDINWATYRDFDGNIVPIVVLEIVEYLGACNSKEPTSHLSIQYVARGKFLPYAAEKATPISRAPMVLVRSNFSIFQPGFMSTGTKGRKSQEANNIYPLRMFVMMRKNDRSDKQCH